MPPWKGAGAGLAIIRPLRKAWSAQAYFQLGRYNQAVEVLSRRLTRNPNTDVSRVLLATSYGLLRWAEGARSQGDAPRQPKLLARTSTPRPAQ
jgi:predicted Zn-dependent protease